MLNKNYLSKQGAQSIEDGWEGAPIQWWVGLRMYAHPSVFLKP